MSKLEELIKEYCPDGVEYKPLGEIATILRGGNFQKKHFVAEGVPCIHYGQIYTYYGLFTDTTVSFLDSDVAVTQKYAEPGDIIMAVTSENIDDVCGCVGWLGSEKIAISGHTAIIHHSLDTKYLTYWFNSTMFDKQKRKMAQGTKVIEVAPKKLEKMSVPVPPLEVQHEIVRILDNFTELTAELIIKLSAELTARKKQYEYYKNELFDLGEDVVWKTLGEIAKNCDAMRKPVTKGQRTSGNIPYYGASGIVDYVDDYIFDGDYLLVSEDGANLLARVTPIAFSITGKNWVNNHAHVLDFDDKYVQRYAELYLNNVDLKSYISGAAQPKLNQKKLNIIPIPLPEKNDIHRIVDTLDRFDELCNDITNGLPAEIEARQKQYEYYRDKLLTFKEKKQ